jgi:hypothetical protein
LEMAHSTTLEFAGSQPSHTSIPQQANARYISLTEPLYRMSTILFSVLDIPGVFLSCQT